MLGSYPALGPFHERPPCRFDPEVKLKPQRLPLSFFAWIRPVLKYPEDDVLMMSGMDVVVFLRLLNYGMGQ